MTLRNGSVLIDGYPVLLTVWTSGWPGKGRSATFTYKTAADGTADSYVYDCCAPSLHVDRHGVTNRFTYDGNKRLESALAPFDAQTSTALAFSYLGEGELAALGVAAATGPDLPAARGFYGARPPCFIVKLSVTLDTLIQRAKISAAIRRSGHILENHPWRYRHSFWQFHPVSIRGV